MDLLLRTAGQEVTVAGNLEPAGLSNRALYRHFVTREDVIRAL